jgi:hypothetical protein
MVMAGYEYSFSFAFDDLLGEVVFQITNSSKSVIYYSSLQQTYDVYDKQFAVDESKMLKVIILVPNTDIRNVKYGPPRCAGLLIEFNKQPHLGF